MGSENNPTQYENKKFPNGLPNPFIAEAYQLPLAYLQPVFSERVWAHVLPFAMDDATHQLQMWLVQLQIFRGDQVPWNQHSLLKHLTDHACIR